MKARGLSSVQTREGSQTYLVCHIHATKDKLPIADRPSTKRWTNQAKTPAFTGELSPGETNGYISSKLSSSGYLHQLQVNVSDALMAYLRTNWVTLTGEVMNCETDCKSDERGGVARLGTSQIIRDDAAKTIDVNMMTVVSPRKTDGRF